MRDSCVDEPETSDESRHDHGDPGRLSDVIVFVVLAVDDVHRLFVDDTNKNQHTVSQHSAQDPPLELPESLQLELLDRTESVVILHLDHGNDVEPKSGSY